ncbi:winged helix-turn-helix domain-containing protein [Dyella sp. LX-66]|uniref:winged helix-turn-helix domain-containing protein n=1 Tax=unclassified Dyella TaxID=2634549 RepID=UPI001BE057F1|nr:MULTISPECIES: winged helix-turn-helix domain-containing protein [unclassified Dyella]MBT2119820.1 winged helix-turn-helix domain-containing protein [Dyella sp. LX-1]MBT2142297.1 winged helix-turn-helix domain-containing protein [Dyella sp. LX-66]
MEKPVYVFGRYRLDPLARELRGDGELVTLPASAFDCLVYLVEHRQRPVGKDELIAAVWGRTEVSDNLLAQHIVRLRRLWEGDTSCIRTVPRVGYHWVAETSVDTVAPEAVAYERSAAEPVAVAVDDEAAAELPPPSHRRRYLWIAGLAIAACAVLAAGWWWHARKAVPASSTMAPAALVVVLPAKVQAEGEWGWLRYGVMDIVANHLRAAGLRTVPSETVVALYRDGAFGDEDDSKRPFDATWQVTPEVKFLEGHWRIHLGLRSAEGHVDGVDVIANDVLAAAKQASDALVRHLGVPGSGTVQSPSQLDDWLAKVAAARMENQIDVAQKVIDGVPESWRNDPKIEYTRAILECDRGERDACEKRLRDLLARLDKEQSKDLVLRGRVLFTLGLRYASARQMDRGAAMLDEAIRLLEQAKASDELANAYLNRAWLAQTQDKLDLAMTYLGKGRATYTLTGNVFGMSRADFDMGLIAAKQGQLDSAMSFLQRAYDQDARYGARTMLPAELDGMASVAKQQLKYRDELAITDRFWPLSADLVDVHMRRELTFVRAIALADNGRMLEASSLAHQLLREIDPREDAMLAAEVPALLAQMAYEMGDDAEAARNAHQAMAQQDGLDQQDRSTAWLVLVRALARGGHADEAAKEAERFDAWAKEQPPGDGDWPPLYADLAQAELVAAKDVPRGLVLLEGLLARARKEGVPALIVNVGSSYASALLQAGQADQALTVSGTLSAWAQDDVRVVALEARIYQALGHDDARDKALQRAKLLAGERPLPSH